MVADVAAAPTELVLQHVLAAPLRHDAAPELVHTERILLGVHTSTKRDGRVGIAPDDARPSHATVTCVGRTAVQI